MTNTITVETSIKAPISKVRDMRNGPEHIVNRAFATDTWECPKATNDLQVGGKFITTMAAKDGSTSFDFNGVYTEIENHALIAYTIEGGRKVRVMFEDLGDMTKVTETFDPEEINPLEMQQGGRQSILNNFKKYVESQA